MTGFDVESVVADLENLGLILMFCVSYDSSVCVPSAVSDFNVLCFVRFFRMRTISSVQFYLDNKTSHNSIWTYMKEETYELARSSPISCATRIEWNMQSGRI